MCRVVKKTQSQLISIILNTSNRVEGSPSLTCLYRERDINTREARSTHIDPGTVAVAVRWPDPREEGAAGSIIIMALVEKGTAAGKQLN